MEPTSFKEMMAGSAQVAGKLKKAFIVLHKVEKDGKLDTELKTDLLESTAAVLTPNGKADQDGRSLKANLLFVQYNPSTLTIQANAESVRYTALQRSECEGVINQNVRMPTVMLGVDLIFDAVNPQDAFMMDKVRLTADGVVSDVAGEIMKKKGGYTVQPQTNALLALAMRPATKFVTFCWGNMNFSGVVSEVQAEYTMFSVSGRPIRSRVRMNIAQAMSSAADNQYWNKALDRVFNDENEIYNAKKFSQTASNLLNLNNY